MNLITKKHKYFYLNIISPVILGGAIYTFYRDKNILLFDWYNYLELTNYVLKLRLFFNPDDTLLIELLPNATLWVPFVKSLRE